MSCMRKLSDVIAQMKKYQGYNPGWLWDLAEAEFGWLKGHGWLIDPAEVEEFKTLADERFDT